MHINQMVFSNATKAWKGINEFLATQEKQIIANGGGIYGPELISYNNFVIIKNLKTDPEFDFGTFLAYKDKKWSSLVNNYVDFNYLDQIKAEIQLRVKKKARSYNYAYHFNNTHGSGKDCLISLNFTKRLNIEHPILVFEVRTSEVTKRLAFDFLLVQRMSEYIYGTEQKVEMHFIAPSFYLTAEHFLCYNNVRPIKKVMKQVIADDDLGDFQRKILKVLKSYSKIDPMSLQYRSFRRAAQAVQGSHGASPMLAKDLSIFKKTIHDFPDDVVSPKKRSAYSRKMNKAKREAEGIIRKPRKSKKTK